MRHNVLAAASLVLLANTALTLCSQAGCPSYTEYSSVAHGPFSAGKYRIPSMRPPRRCRTFVSAAVERVVEDVTAAIADPDWKHLFGNTFGNTLDTTVAWHDDGSNGGSGSGNSTKERQAPYTFLITGDITAQWIRDSTNQMMPYIAYAADDEALARLVLGLINMQAEELAAYPYGNAFQPPARSGLTPSRNGIGVDVRVTPAYDSSVVFEAKFEIDSFASFFQLGNRYWAATGDAAFAESETWQTAVAAILAVVRQQQQPTFGADNRPNRPAVTYARKTWTATETQFVGGGGNPAKRTGMVRTLFRPSDDATVLPFLVPANAFLAAELRGLGEMLGTLGAAHADAAREATALGAEIRRGVMQHGTAQHPTLGRVLAYETDGYGSALLMDDANGPSLLALPLLGFIGADDPLYLRTREMVLSADHNPWFFVGSAATGVGSPHTGVARVWPMAVAMRALTSANRTEVAECLDQLKATTAGLGLMHESVNAASPADYTRSWFAWCNSLVGQLVVDALARFPGII
ncbi:hypothetical protein H4S06_000630 [Coemansia sp. BCRC 34490]|nr:hypothetical protein H4S06_000630 [Coemansia sp. BCRC 34490]